MWIKKTLLLSSFGLMVLLFQNFSFVDSKSTPFNIKHKKLYKNPLSLNPCADPVVLNDVDSSGYFYKVCTGVGFKVFRSKDLINWNEKGLGLIDSKNSLAKWGRSGRSWAPHLDKVSGRYLAYYTQNKQSPENGRLNGAIGVSISSDLERDSFQEVLKAPLVVNHNEGGVIDPSFFEDPQTKKNYLLYKVDGNSIGLNTRIEIVELNAEGTRVIGKATSLIQGGRNMSDLVEGQDLIKHGEYYYLFYSQGDYTKSYRVLVARSKNILGPYTGNRVVLSEKSNGKFFAPGHGVVVKVKDTMYYFYHAWVRGSESLKRLPMVDPIFWSEDYWPLVNDGYPSERSQYRPLIGKMKFNEVKIKIKNSNLINPNFSLDVQDRLGNTTPACLNAAILLSNKTFSFNGDCKSVGNFVRPTTNTKFRVCAAQNGDWSSKNRKIKCTKYSRFLSNNIEVSF